MDEDVTIQVDIFIMQDDWLHLKDIEQLAVWLGIQDGSDNDREFIDFLAEIKKSVGNLRFNKQQKLVKSLT